MAREETAPPIENWSGHLAALGDQELAELARDYRWLTDENRLGEKRQEFRNRREAIIAECERRGMKEAAAGCRPPAAG